MIAKQNPEVKGNPWLVEMLGDNKARVPSASDSRLTFNVDLALQTCNCGAFKRCWHLDTSELRARLDVTVANCRSRYSRMRLTELMAEDDRLRALLAEDDSHSLRAQYGECGNAINALFYAAQEIA